MKKRRYPLLSEQFEREALAILDLTKRMAREFVMLPDGDIVPRERPGARRPDEREPQQE